MAFLLAALSWEPRSCFPSMAFTCPWVNWLMACTHSMKLLSNSSGLSAANTLPNVSWEGIPFGSFKNPFSHSSLVFPNNSMSTQLSAPQITPQMAITRMSSNLCRLVRSMRGSLTLLKCFAKLPISGSGDMGATWLKSPFTHYRILSFRCNRPRATT